MIIVRHGVHHHGTFVVVGIINTIININNLKQIAKKQIRAGHGKQKIKNNSNEISAINTHKFQIAAFTVNVIHKFKISQRKIHIFQVSFAANPTFPGRNDITKYSNIPA